MYRKIILDHYISTAYGKIHAKKLGSLGDDLARSVVFFKHNYLRLLPKNKDVEILELGPGMGQFLYFLKKNSYHKAMGIDGSKEVADYCKKNGLDVEYVPDFTPFLRQKENMGRFDVIIANDIFEQFTKDELVEILTLLKESLKTGGTIIGKTPNASACFVGSNNRYWDFTHEVSFTENSLRQVFYSLKYAQVELFEPNLFCFYKHPLNYVGILLTFLLRSLQLLIHRLNGNFDVKIVSGNLLFKITK